MRIGQAHGEADSALLGAVKQLPEAAEVTVPFAIQQPRYP